MKKYRFKKSALYMGLLALVGSGTLGIYSMTPKDIKEEKEVINKTVEYEENLPVINEQTFIKKPFNNDKVNILKNFYDKDVEENIQENSIIYYDSTYMQNSSIAYGGPEKFDVVAILDGKVKDVREDDLIGTVIEIEHDNGLLSVYQSVSDIKVKKDSLVSQGELIASSGTSTINKDLNSHLLFELQVNKEIVNPENYYGKDISNLTN